MEKELTLKEIRADLREIRYYYSRLSVFKAAEKDIGSSETADTVKMYNEAIRRAPLILYDVYNGLYVKNSTQVGFAVEMGYTAEYLSKLHMLHIY